LDPDRRLAPERASGGWRAGGNGLSATVDPVRPRTGDHQDQSPHRPPPHLSPDGSNARVGCTNGPVEFCVVFDYRLHPAWKITHSPLPVSVTKPSPVVSTMCVFVNTDRARPRHPSRW